MRHAGQYHGERFFALAGKGGVDFDTLLDKVPCEPAQAPFRPSPTDRG